MSEPCLRIGFEQVLHGFLLRWALLASLIGWLIVDDRRSLRDWLHFCGISQGIFIGLSLMAYYARDLPTTTGDDDLED